MANASAKKQAISNTNALKLMHLSALGVNAFVFLFHFLLKRPASLKPYLLFSIPAFLLQFQLERMGRPSYDEKGSLIKAGDDLGAPGITEWMHDVIYVTWGCAILSAVFNSTKVWFAYLVIPLYASYKLYSFISAQSGGFFNGGRPAQVPEQQQPGVSKRQEKLQKKRQKFSQSIS